MDFMIDGIIDLEVERTYWPTITFTDDLDRQVLIIQIDAASSNIVITNVFEVRTFLDVIKFTQNRNDQHFGVSS